MGVKSLSERNVTLLQRTESLNLTFPNLPTYLVTGGAGFIGSTFVLSSRLSRAVRLMNLDRLTYRESFRFLQVSTDEVYGSLEPEDPPFHERTPYAPNSPYSASKAASDHLVRAYHHTYGLPTLITNCSNNFGPRQFPEKLIPLMLLNAIEGKPLPVYGDGLYTRDWLYVEDHCEAIHRVLEKGRVGETYNIGGCCVKTNLQVLTTLCAILDEIRPDSSNVPHASLTVFVKDRPGHDRRYAIDCSKIREELGWEPERDVRYGIEKDD